MWWRDIGTTSSGFFGAVRVRAEGFLEAGVARLRKMLTRRIMGLMGTSQRMPRSIHMTLIHREVTSKMIPLKLKYQPNIKSVSA